MSKQPKTAQPKTQTDPPSVPIKQLFTDCHYPEGELMDHPIVDTS